jgi:hypothetical protein
MGTRKFSVGKIKRGDGSYVGVCTGITVRYDGNPQEFRGGDYRYPLDIVPGDQSLVVTAETADYGATEPTFGVSETLELEAGANAGGIVVTLTNMVLVTAEITSSQNAFVASSLEWRKKDVEV